jgi:hypothetical protein
MALVEHSNKQWAKRPGIEEVITESNNCNFQNIWFSDWKFRAMQATILQKKDDRSIDTGINEIYKKAALI